MPVKSGWIGCLALCGGLITEAALAECLPPQQGDVAGYSVCKEWPAYPGQILNAATKLESDGTAGNDDTSGTYDLVVSIRSSTDNEMLADYYKRSAFVSDAIALQGLELDTARYKLSPELRAFGVRVSFKGSSRVNPMDETWLTLYVKEGRHLRPVLDRLVVYGFSGEWDGNCAGERATTVRTLEMAKTSSHGYADLIVKSVTTGVAGEGTAETCELKTTTNKPVLTTLRYDGKAYVIPADFKGI
ncbi:hypothetical protein PseuLF5_08595 [Pseudomonas sp. LF-5]|uniref:hypothetical protein n=1 Tax=Pseudomonas sp. LF-5 TaxID=3031121 RepID=UPI003095A59F